MQQFYRYTYVYIFNIIVALSGDVDIIVQVHSFDVHLVQCTSSREPMHCSVEILINNSSRDLIRYASDKCIHKQGNCKHNVTCSCSSNCHEFTWYGDVKILQNQTISCKMRFSNDTTKTYTTKIASVIYIGEGKTIIKKNQQMTCEKYIL